MVNRAAWQQETDVQQMTPRQPAWGIVAALAAAFIVYGSLYPFRFEKLAPGVTAEAVVRAMLAIGTGGRGDVLANLVLYVPLGFALAGALVRRGTVLGAVLLAVQACVGLSAAIEVTQIFVPGRTPSVGDVGLNALGGTLGAMAGGVVGRRSGLDGWPMLRDGGAALLLGAWLGYRLYPYVPAIDRGEWIASLRPLFWSWAADPVRVLRLAGAWLVACRLLAAAVPWGGRLAAAGMMLAVLAAAVPLVDRVVSPAEVLAVAVALPVWLVLRGRGWADRVLLGVLVLVVLAEGLAPYRFADVGRGFSWVPFGALVGGQYTAGLQAGLQKFFLYGGLLWLAGRVGMRAGVATVAVAGLALAIGLAQTQLAGRSAEVTDAVLVLMAALVLRAGHPARDGRG